MALTKIGSIGINTGIQFAGVTTIATLNASDNVLSVGGTVNFVSDVSIGGTVSIAGTLTYEDVTNVDAVGLITARNGIKVGSGITLSSDGDIFTTGISTFGGNSTFSTSGGDDAVVIKGDTFTTLKIQSARDSSDSKAFIQLHASRGSNASPTIIQNGDTVGTINARAYDGNSYASMSDINFEVDGAPGDGDMPGRIVFKTSADGSQSPSERARITSTGRLGISATDPQVTLDVGGSSSGGLNGLTNSVLYAGFTNNTNFGGVVLGAGANGNSPFIAASKKSDGTALSLDVITDGTSRARITDTGELLVGTTTLSPHMRLNQRLGIAYVGDYGGASITNYGGTTQANKPVLDFNRSRGTSNASMTSVASGDGLAHIIFRGADGTNFIDSAAIRSDVDGTPGTNDMPGRLVFETTPDGSNTLTERMRITSGGAVQISGADDQDNLLVKGVGTGFAVHQDDTDGEVSLRAQDVTGSNNAKFMTFFVQKAGESPSEAMRISNTRKVGIATVSPNAQLHVLTTNEAGILIEDSSTGNNAPYLEVMAKRTDGNVHQSFSGQIFLSRNRTEQKISSGLKLGTILFGGNHTNASKSNIAFPASIAGISTGNFDDVNNMPTALTFYTGFTGRTRLQSNVSSGVERMRISPEGYITKPYQPACTAHQMASAINTNGENNHTEVVFTQTITNRGSHYNTSNGRFTCPVGGVYHVSAGFLTRKGSATNAFHNVFIYKSGSNTGLKARDINNANELHITVAGLIDCNAGQYLSVYVSNDGGDFWSDYNYFSVHLVG